jgi:flagellar biosynthesis protein FlhF
MNANVFSARTVKEALRKVREVLGPDAVIINETRRQGFVEITASVEYPQAGEAVRVRRSETAEYVERLRALGFDMAFIDTVTSSLDRAAGWDMVERQIARMIGIAARPVTLARGRVRLIGPPGSGKTTSVIRLAANHVLNFGADQIAIISQDVNRLAGSEQLLLASELLRVPVYEADDERSLRVALAEASGKSLVIIDTPGVVATHRLPESICDLAGFETFLVLPATFHPTTLRRLVQLARPLVPTGVLLSHVDAVDSIGELLSICRAEQLPFSWVGAGGEMADGLESATASLLVDYATRSLAPVLDIDQVVTDETSEPKPAARPPRGREIATA